MKQFIKSFELSNLTQIAGDASSRVYYRAQYKGQSVIVMDCEAGAQLSSFINIGVWLNGVGLNAPEVLGVDKERGFLLLEDFGDISFKRAIEQGTPRQKLYALGVDILLHLKTQDCAPLDLPNYRDSRVYGARGRVVDTYLPEVLGITVDEAMIAEYLDIWARIETRLAPCPMGFTHIDYHVENLMWRGGAAGLSRAGIIDYQGAVYGPLPYDLTNLLEDARIDVPDDLRECMLDRYCAGMSTEERVNFMAWYQVLAMQFHGRLLGQFIDLAKNDGKEQYLEYLPRVLGNFRRSLKQPLLSEVNDWFIAQGVDFNIETDLNDF